MPFTADAKKGMYALDKGAIEKIKGIDPEGFLGYVKEKEATICGALPIAALMKAVGAKKAKLLKYYTSGDVIGDYSSAVGYASIAFY
jgi:AmmeMemoRadiSam system protein B